MKNLYSVQRGDSIRYAYGAVQRGTNFDIWLDATLDKHFRFDKWVIIGIIHTHPNYSSFSDTDKSPHRDILPYIPNFTTYAVFGPTPDSFIIRKLYGCFDILVYPNRGGGTPGVRNTRINSIF